jgi:predicted DNA-binding protein
MNNGLEMKYAALRVKYETQERVNQYIAERSAESGRGKRITVDEAINTAFDALEHERKQRL